MTNEQLKEEKQTKDKEMQKYLDDILPKFQKELNDLSDKYNVKLVPRIKVQPFGIIPELVVTNVDSPTTKTIPSDPYKQK